LRYYQGNRLETE